MWNAALAFCHGGLYGGFTSLTPFPSNINNLGRSLLEKLDRRDPLPQPYPPGPYPGLPSDTTLQEQELYGANGPLWYRRWAEDTENAQFCSRADAVIRRIGVRRMIMGHTPNFQRIVSRCNGKVVIIDTGITPAYGGVLSALRVEYSLYPVKPLAPLTVDQLHLSSDKNPRRQWKEVEVLTAIYHDRHEFLTKAERVINLD